MSEDLVFTQETEKNEVFTSVENYLKAQGFQIVDRDLKRHWGGFYVLDESQIDNFIQTYFAEHQFSDEEMKSKMSPKILLVAPHKRLSDQSHERRSEIWKVIVGPVGVFTAEIADDEGETNTYEENEIIQLPQGKRHRLIGQENWGIVAEIWRHTDLNKPSNEDDIIRYQDDFGR
ncbi:MAG TPA: hypothetical protein VK338_01325 [Candidatus Nitrosocosmicus sp.]|nr:hypothetical protein [Candidatus Nitrosocosmicus sp.]